MEKALVRKTPLTPWSMAAIVAIIGIGLIALFPPGGNASPSGAAAAAGGNSSSTASSTVTSGNGSPAPANGQAAGNGASSIPAAPGAVITIHLLTPISGNTWKEGGANPIAWDNPAGVTGEIELVDAVTKVPIGIILAETGPNQTSYTWDAREVYRGRYSADEMAVVPGTYSVMIHFDGNGLGDLISGPITITD
ncbi:MAG TPA: hypothetical protein VMA75_01860 [Candidatus Paceibacterota bacterium]|nr:hypothetical protein [Candidatus Paceibacterota bacterium]